MKKKPLTIVLGILLTGGGVFLLILGTGIAGAILIPMGFALLLIGFKPGRTSTIVFGHMSIIAGCILVTWGIYLLPYSQPRLADIFLRPLFWGLFAIFGGICANYHGFCSCVRRNRQ